MIVEARNLTKIFDGKKAVEDISFDIAAGEIFGLLGPNGAGKTTTIRMLLNILTPTSGRLTLFGRAFSHDRAWILQQMNASSGTLTLPGKLTVQQSLRVFADLYSLPDANKRIEELLEKFDLEEFRHRTLYSLSTGQQVRASLAKAMLNRPALLLLDEPTASLDPDVADRVRTFLVDVVKEEGSTVFLTSHNMAEVERVCSRVIFINKGRIQAEGSPRELTWQLKRVDVNIVTDTPLSQFPAAAYRPNMDINLKGCQIEIELDRDDVGFVISQLVKEGIHIKTLSTREPTLEDFFVHSTRKELI
jgi:ABC-2 type transport system ATP-binding protein